MEERGATRVAVEATAKFLDNPFKGWTTIEEAAEIVGRRKSTIGYWANKGRISCFSVGRRVKLVNIDEVRDFAEQNPPLSRRSVDKPPEVG
jgi:excisionase family DNA binding protein